MIKPRYPTRFVDVGLNIVLVLLLGWVIIAPAGPVRATLTKLWNDWSNKVAINRAWSDLVSGGHTATVSGAVDTVVVFMDFQCPACKLAHDALGVEQDGGARATVVYRHLPLTGIHPNSEGAARASLCAQDQGMVTEMNAVLYETSSWHDQADWIALADSVGISRMDAFSECMTSERVRDRLRE